MPRLWRETIDSHREAVREAALDAAAALVAEHGLRAVTMSQVAQATGIGRATLYNYFSDVQSILSAWHERQVATHLDELRAVRDRVEDPGTRLAAVLGRYAAIAHQTGRHGAELGAALHRDGHATSGHDQLNGILRELLREAAEAGEVRADVAPPELAAYCLNALNAARALPSEAAVSRLLEVTMTGLGMDPRHTHLATQEPPGDPSGGGPSGRPGQGSGGRPECRGI